MGIGGWGVINADWPKTISKYYKEIDIIKSMGYTRIRFGNCPPEYTNAMAMAKAIMLYAVSIGLEVVSGPTKSSQLTAANWPAYEAEVIAFAQWAQANGLYGVSTGNELESVNDNTTLPDGQLIDNLKALSIIVRTHFSGYVTYSSTGGATIVNLWGSKGFDPNTEFHKLSFNVYGGGQSDLSGFTADCQRIFDHFGTNAEITEFGLVNDNQSLTLTPSQQKSALDARIAAMETIGFQRVTFFTWMMTNPTQVCALKFVEGNYRQQVLSLPHNGGLTIAQEESSIHFEDAGVQSRVDFGNHVEFHNAEFTFTFHIRPSMPNTHRTIIGWSENFTPQIRIASNNQLQLVKQNIGIVASSGVTLDAKKWYKGAVKFAANGDYQLLLAEEEKSLEEVASGNSPQTWTYGSARLIFGNLIGYAYPFKGLARSVKGFSRPLTFKETDKALRENCYNTVPDCVFLAQFNEVNGTTAVEDIHGFNGTETHVMYSNHVLNQQVL